jgi:peptidoglycan/xylan/chitin deacetylase (PgdA/CDA1 family)
LPEQISPQTALEMHGIEHSNSKVQAVEITWPAGAQAAVTFSFDDGYDATYETTVTSLQERRLCATYNVITDYIGAVFDQLPTATWSQWRQADCMGHEIASHSAAHVALAGPLSDLRRLLQGLYAAPDRIAYAAQLATRARALWAFIANKQLRTPTLSPRRPSFPSTTGLVASRLSIERTVQGSPVESFAYPSGRYNSASRRAVAYAGFKSARTLDSGLNHASCDLFALRAIALGPSMTADDLTVWLERAITSRTWLIVVLHLVARRNPTGYPYFCSLSEFERLLDAVQSRPFWIATQRQVVRHLMSQKLTRRMV